MTKRKITTLRYFFRDNIPSEKTGIYLSIILIGITFMMLIQVNKYANVSFENDDEYDSQFDLLSDDISDMENFNKLIPETDYYDKVYITAGQFYLSRRRLPLL